MGDAYGTFLDVFKDVYDGLQLASRHDVVIVTANYRLNMLGWRGRHTVDGGASLWDVFGFEKMIR